MNQVEVLPRKERQMLMAGGLLAILGAMWIQCLFRALNLSQLEAWGGLAISTIALVVIYVLAFREIQPPK
jgi:hypothetical protein